MAKTPDVVKAARVAGLISALCSTETTESLTYQARELLTEAMIKLSRARNLELQAARKMTDATSLDGMERSEHGRCMIIVRALNRAEELAQQSREALA